MPLTRLNEEEEIFRATVREFAEERVRPRVEEMERTAAQPADLLQELFELGLMGIEIPEEFGGAGASFFMSILAMSPDSPSESRPRDRCTPSPLARRGRARRTATVPPAGLRTRRSR